MANSESDKSAKELSQTTVLRLPRSSRRSGNLSPAARSGEAPQDRIDWDKLEANSQLSLYNEFVEGLYDAVIITNLKGWIVDANSRASDFFHIQRKRFRGLRVIELISGADEALFNQLLDDMANGVRLILEAYCIRGDRTYFPAEVTVNQIHVRDQPHICFLIRNITRRVAAEKALRQSEARFRDISESMSDWIWEMSPDGLTTYLSENASRILGFPQEAMLGVSFLTFTSLEHRALAQRGLAEHLSTAATFRNLEVYMQTAAKEWRCISYSGCPFFDDDNELLGYRGIAADITEQKQKDVELTRHRNHLEELVSQRTAQLKTANDQLLTEISERHRIEQELRLAVTDLERWNADMQQFGYVVSHDLKEPLRMIASYCGLLSRRYASSLDDTARDYIGFAVDGAERMRHMIDDLLAYTQLTTADRHCETCDLNQIASHCIRNLKLAIEEADADINIEDLPTVAGNRTQLLLLLQNLITNSLKFRHADRPLAITITSEVAEVETEDSESQQTHWAIHVTDNGIGIPAESLEYIFQIFHRLHMEREYSGTGIGLAICRKIVDNHGGMLLVESDEGEGSRFTFTLPLLSL